MQSEAGILCRSPKVKKLPAFPTATVIPEDAELAGALADLVADKSCVENVREFVIAHARTRFIFFVCHAIIRAVLQTIILVLRRCIVRSIIPPAKSGKLVCG